MTFRCTSCQATLRFDEQKMAGRRSAKCPRCQASVELPPSGQASSASTAGSPGSQSTKTTTVACGACGVRLKVPDGVKASRSRCPRCGGSIDLAPAPERAARPEVEESANAATRRIDSRALSMELAASMSTPPATAPPLTPMVSPEPQEPAPSLTRPAVGPMRDAALGIRAATQGMEQPAAPQPPVRQVSGTTPSPAAPITPKPEPAPRPAPPAPIVEMAPKPAMGPKKTEPSPEREKTRRSAPVSYPLWRGGLSGALAGGIVGLALWGGEKAIASNGLTWLLSTVPPAARIEGVPEWTMRLAFLVAGAIVAGLIACGAGSPGRNTSPITVKRCLISALLPAILIALLSILMGEQPLPEFAVWPAVNWMRDLLVAGLLTPAVNRFIPGSR